MTDMPVTDNPYLGLFFGKETQVTDSKRLSLPIMFSPGEFSIRNTGRQETFVRRICAYAKTHRVAILGGTEAAQTSRNKTFQLLHEIPPNYGFHFYGDPDQDCWVLVNKDFGTVTHAGYIPVIPGQPGPAAAGGHGPRGIMAVAIKPNDPRYGDVHAGVSHFVTKGQDPNTERGRQNVRLGKAIDSWGSQKGGGDSLAFHMADTNNPMPRRHPYSQQWVT
ncbi:MAG TPA: hypothetical protein VIY48_04995, partial [Candidatus Paceibacterota bacterium]